MNTSLKLLALAGVLCAGLLSLDAADKKHLGGPKGGRLLEKTDPKAEFLKGDGYNIVVQFKPTPSAKPQNIRFKLETHTCAGCNRAEYGCICDE